MHWPEQVAGLVADAVGLGGGRTLAYGNGRSYGDSCLAENDHVVVTHGADRVIQADWKTGTVEVQAGISLAMLIRLALPRGWFLPVTPGTKFVTVGGAVANDVHGKNHHVMGTFGQHVKRLTLFRSDLGVVECSREMNADLFAATVAGLGLTGIILSVVLQFRRVQSGRIAQRSIKFDDLTAFFAISAEHDASHEYAVAWIDCLASGHRLGRGHYLLGNHAEDGDFTLAAEGRLSIPVDPPVSLINHVSLRLFNSAYFHRQRKTEVSSLESYDAFFYPLDGILNWNRIYGRAGFQQYQCVVPAVTAQDAITELLSIIARDGAGSFLAVLKTCGDARSPGLLSFPMAGTSLALDFAQHETKNRKLFERLDAVVHEAGGRLYPAKDAHMSARHFQDAYPSWEKVEGFRDSRIMSRFWARVTH